MKRRGCPQGGGTPIYLLGRDVPTVRVSFSGSSVLNRVYIFRFSCLKQGRPRKSPFLPLWSHNFRWFRAPSLKCVKTQTYVPFLVFLIRPAWSSLEQGKKLQHFLLERVAKFTSFVSWTGSGFRWVGRTPLPKFLLSLPPLPPLPQLHCWPFTPAHFHSCFPLSVPNNLISRNAGPFICEHQIDSLPKCLDCEDQNQTNDPGLSSFKHMQFAGQ